MNRRLQLKLCAWNLTVFTFFPTPSLAWNIPGHMVVSSIAYQVLQRDNPGTIPAIRSILEKHPWYENRWRGKLESVVGPERDEFLFMLAAGWADEIRTQDRTESRPKWHYIGWPFKPDGEPEWVQTKPPEPVNILTAIAENTRIARSSTEPEKRAIAVAWLFHLVGDIHQPLHTIQLFTREYPNGDRGGNKICVRVALNRAPIELHRLWDGLITSSRNTNQLSKIASSLLSKFSISTFRELDHAEPESWAKESYEMAAAIAYENGSLRGTPKGQAHECRAIDGVSYLSRTYPAKARLNADQRVYLAGFRLADLLTNSVR